MPGSTDAIAFGAGRSLFGVAILVTPGRITRAWVGADDTRSAVLARCLGGRDIVLGAGLVLAAARGHDPRPWLAGGALADAVDGIATLAAGGDIPGNGRLGTAALAGGSALFGAWLASAID
jgi:hypothetical protein